MYLFTYLLIYLFYSNMFIYFHISVIQLCMYSFLVYS